MAPPELPAAVFKVTNYTQEQRSTAFFHFPHSRSSAAHLVPPIPTLRSTHASRRSICICVPRWRPNGVKKKGWMGRSLVSDPRYRLLSSDYDGRGVCFSRLVRSGIFVCCVGSELCSMCWSDCVARQSSSSGHSVNVTIPVCRHQKSSNWRIRLIQLNHTAESRSPFKHYLSFLFMYF